MPLLMRRQIRRALYLATTLIASLLLFTWLYGVHFLERAPGMLPIGGSGPGAGGGGHGLDRVPLVEYPGPQVALRQGRYVGTSLWGSEQYPRAVEAFRGVPYAQTTGGENRFRLPVRMEDSQATFMATGAGKICPGQYARGNIGEDCLNANVYRPVRRETKGQGLWPVVVFVHGGSFNSGSGEDRDIAGFVSWAEPKIVGVSFNYRVGALGFLPAALTARKGILNLGLRDQQMLLEWVRDNVEAFGGDPERVTIMGLSAGAHAVGHHIMYYAQPSAPKAPFAKAILESGATTARAIFFPTHPRHLTQFREFLIECGIESIPEEDMVDRLRRIPLQTIMAASTKVWQKNAADVTWPFQPVIDGPNPHANSSRVTYDSFVTSSNSTKAALLPVIPDLPITLWRAGRHLDIPIITGFNTNEGAMFVPGRADTNAQFRSFFARLLPGLNDADLDALEALYPDPDTGKGPYRHVGRNRGRQHARLDAAYSDFAYICPVLQTAHFAGSKGPVRVYKYAALGRGGMANHADEDPVVSHDGDLIAKFPGLHAVADVMHGAWVRFIASPKGDPGARLHVTTGAKTDKITEIEWPVWVSPFPTDGASSLTRTRGDADQSKGRLMLFGAGNDERALHDDGWFTWTRNGTPGTPAQVAVLGGEKVETCRFWWEREELSEGLGMRERVGNIESGQ